ncbi:TolC family protein [Panacibacter ginsenosidivorans]|uniref:TolC family protein n=1 Tax=Panacibacter ginsenosidivorans TaxID=1813871 RepID=A0A5B8VBY4_9BACT|nr:TolC family protein [Panacibacter ginsenosidivorans]QEC69037.1 TolC family protein [Panacibacter ginsenosidivorans]
MKRLIGIVVITFVVIKSSAQNDLLQQATLDNVVQYALQHQPLLKQSAIDEQITEQQIKSKLSDWYPQVNFAYNYQHNFELQKTVFAGNTVQIGVNNTSALQFTATQNLFNRDVLLASRTADDVRKAIKQNTTNTRIDIAVYTIKAFYDVLATTQQIKVAAETIIRLERSLKDATAQYSVGVADKTDYKRATIALNNARASKSANENLLKAKLEYLKTVIGYPTGSDLNIVYDSLAMEKEIYTDTLQSVDYTKRIEYLQLTTQKKLQEANLKYNKWSYIPTLSAYGAYNLNYQNNSFGKLYNTSFPNSYAGLSLGFPIFQGFKRTANIKQAQLEITRVDWDIINLQKNISAEYAQALASYKASLTNYQALKENVDLAKEVYDVIQLQYKAGVKTYLEVITAETDLRSAEINYYNALYQVLANKTDVQKALGQINY